MPGRREKEKERTDPEALQAIAGAKGECDAEREREDVVREDIKRRAEVLASLSAQHAAARACEAVCDLEGRDEGHHLRDELHDRRVVAEEVAVYLAELMVCVCVCNVIR